MELESLRPIFSGIAGGIITILLVAHWSRHLPTSFNSKTREDLLREHRVAVWSANALFLSGIFFGLALYKIGDFARNDWRPLALGFGLASFLPLVSIAVLSRISGRSVKEAYIAFAWGQGTPLWVTYGILGAGVVCLLLGIAGFVT